MIATVFDLLHTTNWSVVLGIRWILFTATSVAKETVDPNDLNVAMHSVDFTFHTFTVPSELALKTEFIILDS